MTVRIENIKEKKLVGKSMKTSYADYRISGLWSSFMPRRNEIKKQVKSFDFSNDAFLKLHVSYYLKFAI